MVDIAQSGERWFVEPKVVGSKPTIHPKNFFKEFGEVKDWSYIYDIELRTSCSLTCWKKCLGGGNGRHSGLRNRGFTLASSSLARGTNETLPTEDRLALLKGTLAYGSNYHSKLQNDPRYSVMDPALWCTHNRWTVNYVQSNPQLR